MLVLSDADKSFVAEIFSDQVSQQQYVARFLLVLQFNLMLNTHNLVITPEGRTMMFLSSYLCTSKSFCLLIEWFEEAGWIKVDDGAYGEKRVLSKQDSRFWINQCYLSQKSHSRLYTKKVFLLKYSWQLCRRLSSHFLHEVNRTKRRRQFHVGTCGCISWILISIIKKSDSANFSSA